MHVCTDCDWSVRVDADADTGGDRSREDCNARAIRHYCETEHTIVRWAADRRTTEFRSVLAEDRL